MASSDNLAAIEPWIFKSAIGGGDPWISDAFARETEAALTKALQKSLFNSHQHQPDVVSGENPVSPFLNQLMKPQVEYSAATASTQTTPSGSGSEPETPGSKRRGSGGLGVGGGKVAKRKSRATKKSTTTYIQADPANFRHMVQQVTGVKFGNGQLAVLPAVLKPEPHRQPFINRMQGLLPTLDTSAYLLNNHENNNNHHQETVVSGSTSTGLSQPQATAAAVVEEGSGGGFDFDTFFPTLESWN